MIDGWIIEVNWYSREYWLVKGYEHPEGQVVAVPYYVGSKRWDPSDYLSHPLAPSTTRFLECVGRLVPLVEESRISMRVDPESAYKARVEDLPREIIELIEILGPEYVGISGSWAIFKEKKGSDVDLMIYTARHRDAYRALASLEEEGLVARGRAPRRGENPFPGKLLEASYKGVPYTLKILRHVERLPCTRRLSPYGVYVGPLRILDRSEGHLYPARYRALIGYPGRASEVVVETWRTRYLELREGHYYSRLELFYDSNAGLIIASTDIGGWIKKEDGASRGP